MIPKDAPTQDWHLYYDNTYMSHVGLGPCLITVQNGDDSKVLYAAKINANGKVERPRKTKASELRILWPRPGAYNFFDLRGAGFIGRTPQRHMKRSAYMDHYYVAWAPIPIYGAELMNRIVINAVYREVGAFLEGLEKRKPILSAAVSNKVILWRQSPENPVSLVYMAEEIGHLIDRKLVPHQEADSRLPRILRHLSTIGIS